MSGSQVAGQFLKHRKKNSSAKASTQGSSYTKRKPTYSPYHRIARDIFGDISQNSLPESLCSAIENGNVEKLEKLLKSHPQSVINARQKLTGDTPLIMAAKCGNKEVVSLLLEYGADISLQNDSMESAFDVATRDIQEAMIEQAKSNAKSRDQQLLNASWLGDAVTVRQCLTGEQYIDVNCTNSEGMTPLLLVTRDTELFEKVNSTMQSGYNPVEAMQEILDKQADVDVCDSHGRNALHMIANNRSIHATRMVSMLLSHGGSAVDSEDSALRTPLHYASRHGNTAIIVALVEEGGANVNKPGGERGDTPLMVSAREGQCQTAKYLLSRGADIKAVNEDGDTALAVAKTTSMVHLLKEAWTEATQEKNHTPSPDLESVSDELVASGNHKSPRDQDQKDIDSESEICTPMATISMVTEDRLGMDVSPVGPTFITQQNQLHFRSLSDPALVTMAADQINKTSQEQEVGEPPTGDSTLARATRPLSRSKKERTSRGSPRWRTRSLADITAHHGRQRSSQTKLPALETHGNKPLRSEHQLGPLTPRPAPPDARRYSLDLLQAREDGNHSQVANTGSTAQRKLAKVKHGSADSVAMEAKVGDSSRLLPEVKPNATSKGHRKRALSTGDPKAKGIQRQQKSPQVERRGRVISTTDKNTAKQPTRQPATGAIPRETSGKRGSPTRSSLPVILSNAKPVAMVSVEMDKELMCFQKWPKQNPSLTEGPPQGKPELRNMKSSKSSSTVKPRGEGSVAKAGGRAPPQTRSSTGSIGMLLGTSLFPGHLDPAYPDTTTHHHGNISHTPSFEDKNLLNLPTLPPTTSVLSSPNEPTRSSENLATTIARLHPPLSAVVEVRETLTPSPKLNHKSPLQSSSSNLSGGPQTSSTVISGFSADSLDSSGRGRAHSLETPPKVDKEESSPPKADSLNVRKERTSSVPTLPEVAKAASIITMAAPTPVKVGNIVINYPAEKEGDSPLSPIWYLQRHLSGDSEGDSPDYITSNLGRRTPVPKLRAPESPSNCGRHDSGQGESDSSDKLCSESDDSVDNQALEVGKDEVLRWKKGKLLGKGAYGRVWEGLLDSTRMVAVKEVELDVESQERAEAQFDKLQMEVGILRSLSHRNVVGYLGACMNAGVVYIFMEYVSGGSIQNLLKRFGSLSEKMVSHYTKQILRALHYLHFNKIMHRDVKGANILVTPKGVIKLIDFGCAKSFFEQVESIAIHSVRGTPYWMAPEIIIGHDYGPKSDIWSLGATIHEMTTTHPPWGKLVPEAAMFQIGIGKSFPSLPEEVSDSLKDFYRLCLAREPSERPSADQLLEHNFFQIHRSQPRPPRKKA